MIYAVAILISIFCACIFAQVFLIRKSNHNVVKHKIKKVMKLKKYNLKILFGYENFIINLNNKNIYNYNIFFKNKNFGIKKVTNNCKIIINFLPHNISINFENKTKTKQKVCIIIKIKNERDNSFKINNSSLMINNNFYAFNGAIKVRYNSILQSNFCIFQKFILTNKKQINFKFSNFLLSTMQQNKKVLTKPILCYKSFKLDLKNNVVCYNKKIPINKLFSFKTFSIVKYKLGFLINKNLFVTYSNNNTYIMPALGIIDISNFSSKVNIFFNIKINSKNKDLNNLFNYKLPNLILNKFKKSYIFNTLSLTKESIKNYNLNNVIKIYLAEKKYIELYSYLLNFVIGIKSYNSNIIKFCNLHHHVGKIEIDLNGKKLTFFNQVNNYVEYDNIIYKNINLLHIKEVDISNAIDQMQT